MYTLGHFFLWTCCFSGPLRAVAEDVEMLQISAGCGGPENQMQCLAFSGISHEQFSMDRLQVLAAKRLLF